MCVYICLGWCVQYTLCTPCACVYCLCLCVFVSYKYDYILNKNNNFIYKI